MPPPKAVERFVLVELRPREGAYGILPDWLRASLLSAGAGAS